MKRMILTVVTALLLAVPSANAMSYERASAEARFLTDKMAYELNLDDYQYRKAYDINFNYFYNLNDASDFYGSYWRSRNSALELIFSALQFRNFCRMDYFYRPVYIYRNAWTFPIYRRYPRTRYFRPAPPRPPRPRPGKGFHFESIGGHSPQRPDYDRPRNHRPDNHRPNFENRNFRNQERRMPGNNRNDFRPSDRNDRRKDERFVQMKRADNKTPFGRGRRM